ncbi:UNVERIFIED_CONTAM: SNF1-related protein kinase regulatory subunit gamma-1 [Sesamum radiatum]|uniref:SNF1-related protein kinase regulatory subunit gamma-1 n=1 Tax=Sesamum radiatum TaxID=300843 RepID=A0AAW2V7S2_SESRA
MNRLEMMTVAVEEGETPTSPGVKLGMQVEDLWDVQGSQLSPTEKLNACFESIPVSAFPPAPSSQVVEISSNTSLAQAVKLLAQHKILSAPVVDVKAPEDASWIDRYIGIVEFAGIVVWILHQSEKMEGNSFGPATDDFEDDAGPACSSSQWNVSPEVGDISGSFRWAPFLALQKANSFLTMLLLLSKYRMKSVPVVDLGEAKIDNIITQSAVIRMLQECAGLHWFESWGSKKLFELGLPLMESSNIIKVYEDDTVLHAFKLMRQKGVGGLPVVGRGGSKVVGDITIRDIQFLLIAPEIYKEYRSITAGNFLTAVTNYLEEHQKRAAYVERHGDVPERRCVEASDYEARFCQDPAHLRCG